MKKRISLLLAAIMLFSIVLTGCGKSEPKENAGNNGSNVKTESKSLQDIIDSKKLVFGTSAGYPPFEFHTLVNGKDEIVGLDVEIAKYVADELGVELEISDMEFDKLLGGLSTGMLDMVIAGMNPNPERLKKANFTDIYYEANLSVIVPKDGKAKIATEKDLEGKSMAIQLGTTQEEIANKIKDAKVTSLDRNSDIIMNLKTKKVDCTIMETPVAQSFVKVNDDLMIVEDLIIDSGTGGVSIAVKKGNDEFTEKLNEILAELKSKGLIDKWLVEATELSTKSIK
ncbi:transporter substrate-binding domain-containing protein [Tissierella creatinophila]|uniref:Arginine-binding extracellular protein ArtP n=1 Tax=Tissierella creatinophila DSM 6911 TaxID=1123403 RepID=A0A1U7M6D3_TISCR|nr:transporter substrate-binding domain-containing protein [Tissierella creatinophila]OLS02779.1 arginine-binding extracellular protein ArtP precursor [Tissierella creatinophila DSM 6911]